jgi:hypothetical protein
MLDKPIPQPDLDTSLSFLTALREHGPWNLTAIEPDGPVHSATFTDRAKMRGWLERHVGHANLHFVANPAPNPSGAGGRVRKQDLGRIEFLQGDFDLDKLPEDHPLAASTHDQRKSAVELDMEMQNEPSFLIDSGAGLQGLWRLAESLEVTPENIELVEGKNRWLAQEFSGGESQCADAGHLLRLPGTCNFPNERKRARGRTIASTRLLQSTGQLHDLGAFGFVPTPAKAKVDVTFGAPEEVDLSTLIADHGLPDRLVTLIHEGEVLGETKPGDNSRSGWLFHGVRNLLRHGVVPEQILWLLLDPELGISASVLDPSKHATSEQQLAYAERQVRQALAEFEGTRQADRQALMEEPLDPQWLGGGDQPAKSAADEPARPHPYRRYSIEDLLGLPDPVWTVEGMLLERSLAMLYGAPKSYKTFLAFDLALCIATGRPFHGVPVVRGRVTYVAAEGHAAETRDRVLAWCRENGVKHSELAGWFDLVISGVRLDKPDSVKEFIKADPSPRAVTFFDTLNRNMEGHESDTKDMTAVVAGCDKVRRDLHTAVIIVHHTGIDASRERGSTVLRGAADTRLKVTRKTGNAITLLVEDQRAGPDGAMMYFRPAVVSVGDFDGPDSVVMRLTEAPSANGYQDQGPPKVSADEIMLMRIHERKPAQYSDLVDEEVKGLSKANVYKVRDRLVAGKFLRPGDRPALTKDGTERAQRLLEEEE